MNQAPHLLILSDLHAADPKAIPVIFGPDGDFKGAPNWCGPLWTGLDFAALDWLHLDERDEQPRVSLVGWSTPQPLHAVALDLRMPTVAVRLAGLCARALGASDPAAVALVRDYSCPWGPCWSLWAAGGGQALARWGEDGRGQPATFSAPDLGVDIRIGRPSVEVLAALTLALAPRIAALRRTP